LPDILHGACPEILHAVYPERDVRSFAEFTLSEANVLRMTQREGFRMTGEGFRMISLARVTLTEPLLF
jgi:hypothetical protein